MGQTAMTIRFDAAIPQFTVPDVVRTAEYYRDVLGFQIAGYWDGEQVSLDPDTLRFLESYGATVFECSSVAPNSPMFVRAELKVRMTRVFRSSASMPWPLNYARGAPIFLTARILAFTNNASSWSKTATG